MKGRGASVKLNTIKVSKRTAAPRTRASVRVATADTPEEALAMGDSHDFAMPEMIATLSSDEHDTENGSKEVDPQIVEITENAKAALNEGALEDAVDYYSDIIDIDGEHYEAFLRRGRVHLDLGDYGRAMSDFTVADDLQPDNPHTRVALGDLLFARKEYSRSIEFYNAALVELPEHAMAICRRGIGYYYKRQFPEALRDLEQAYKLDRSIPNIATYVIMAKKKVKNLAQ